MRWGLSIKKVWVITLFISLLSTLVFADENEKVRNTISSQIEAFKENNIEKSIYICGAQHSSTVLKPRSFWFDGQERILLYMEAKELKFTKFQDLGNKSIQRVLFQSMTAVWRHMTIS